MPRKPNKTDDDRRRENQAYTKLVTQLRRKARWMRTHWRGASIVESAAADYRPWRERR